MTDLSRYCWCVETNCRHFRPPVEREPEPDVEEGDEE